MKECEEMSTLKNKEKEKEIIHMYCKFIICEFAVMLGLAVVNKAFFLCFEYMQTIFSCMCLCITPNQINNNKKEGLIGEINMIC
jgi:hypothetical protein